MRLAFYNGEGGYKALQVSISSIGVFLAGVLGYVFSMLGGWDIPLMFLLLCIGLDLLAGLLEAAKEGNINSGALIKGVAKKLFYLIGIAAAYGFDLLVSDLAKADINYFHLVFTLLFAFGEFISILEHGVKLNVGIPKFILPLLKKAKEQLEEGKLPDLGLKS